VLVKGDFGRRRRRDFDEHFRMALNIDDECREGQGSMIVFGMEEAALGFDMLFYTEEWAREVRYVQIDCPDIETIYASCDWTHAAYFEITAISLLYLVQVAVRVAKGEKVVEIAAFVVHVMGASTIGDEVTRRRRGGWVGGSVTHGINRRGEDRSKGYPVW
jgi:hypothetical protein